MQLHKNTIEVLKNFSTVNSNLVVRVGSELQTMSPGKDIIATFGSEDDFATEVSIFNLNEFLGVLSAFDKPELDLDTKSMTIKQGKQKVNYTYADSSLLIVPPSKAVKFPVSDVSIDLSAETLSKLQKMSAILAAEDLAIIGDGKTITLKVMDKKNPTSNAFELDTDVPTSDTFQFNLKMEKLKLFAGDYKIDLSSKKISRWTHSALDLVYLIAVEGDSTFTE